MMIKKIINQIFLRQQDNKKNLIFSLITLEQKELLTEEFKSLGFYLSDHPLNEYEEVFNQLK